MDCKSFGCVYAMKNGCSIEGHRSEEGPLNGKKQRCPHYDVMCVNAKCASCIRGGDCRGRGKVNG